MNFDAIKMNVVKMNTVFAALMFVVGAASMGSLASEGIDEDAGLSQNENFAHSIVQGDAVSWAAARKACEDLLVAATAATKKPAHADDLVGRDGSGRARVSASKLNTLSSCSSLLLPSSLTETETEPSPCLKVKGGTTPRIVNLAHASHGAAGKATLFWSTTTTRSVQTGRGVLRLSLFASLAILSLLLAGKYEKTHQQSSMIANRAHSSGRTFVFLSLVLFFSKPACAINEPLHTGYICDTAQTDPGAGYEYASSYTEYYDSSGELTLAQCQASCASLSSWGCTHV